MISRIRRRLSTKGHQVGRYFGREPRYTRQEIEAQAQQAIEARVGMGRPPAEDWRPLEQRMAEMDPQPVAPPKPSPLPEPEPIPAAG